LHKILNIENFVSNVHIPKYKLIIQIIVLPLWFFKDVGVQFFNNVHGYLNTLKITLGVED
jgi:hypothetical protein